MHVHFVLVVVAKGLAGRTGDKHGVNVMHIRRYLVGKCGVLKKAERDQCTRRRRLVPRRQRALVFQAQYYNRTVK